MHLISPFKKLSQATHMQKVCRNNHNNLDALYVPGILRQCKLFKALLLPTVAPLYYLKCENAVSSWFEWWLSVVLLFFHNFISMSGLGRGMTLQSKNYINK
jgi:hypothetical protein